MDAQYNPRTVEEVFRDFKGRRAGLVRALTAGTAAAAAAAAGGFSRCGPFRDFFLCCYVSGEFFFWFFFLGL